MNYAELFYKICKPKKKDIETDTTKILNPILTLIKLALLSFKPNETKLSIYNHNIFIIPPTIFQGISRGYYGDSKDDLHHLLIPIYILSLWFRAAKISESSNKKNKKSKKHGSLEIQDNNITLIKLHGFDSLVQLAKNGLLALKRTYADHVATKHNLDIIIYVLDGINADEPISYTGIINNYDEELYLKYIWNIPELSAILALFNLCSIEPNKKKYYIESIETVLVPIEENIRDIYM